MWVSTLAQTCFLSRLLRKQLNRYKHKLQGTYTLQKEQNRRFETKIRELATNQDNLCTKLQQIRQDLQVQMWEPLATWTAWKSNLKSALPGWERLLSQSFPRLLAQPLLLPLPSPPVFAHSHPPYWGSNKTKCSCVVFDLKISLYLDRKNLSTPLGAFISVGYICCIFYPSRRKNTNNWEVFESVSKTQSLTNWDMKLINHNMCNIFRPQLGVFRAWKSISDLFALLNLSNVWLNERQPIFPHCEQSERFA